jgi:hypothetical protein
MYKSGHLFEQLQMDKNKIRFYPML